MSATTAANLLDLFSAPVAAWFRRTFGTPTPPQSLGWPVIARGENALILSPTGSGKTLTAFLWSLNALYRELGDAPKAAAGVRVIYVSPLKALNNDVERNLEVPLRGIRLEAQRLGQEPPEIRVAVRTGDTPSSERQKMVRRPPHILITTPESLYLMLTSAQSAATFESVHTVILDEIHTLVGTKRGAHLALSLERLERLVGQRVQRIGLSATVRPLENAARFLGGQEVASARGAGAQGVSLEQHTPRPVTIVDAGSRKYMDLRVVCPVDDFRDVPGNSIWPLIIPEVVNLIEQHRTTLIFCNSRRLAERTADRLNEERLRRVTGDAAPKPHGDNADVGWFAAGIDAATLEASGIQPIRAHHGSMSKVARLEMESALKAGTLPALVATSSLELGIDIGEIDLVVHLQSPKAVGAGLQRVGRSGHLVGQTPKGRVFPTFPEDVVEAAAVARGMLAGEIESTATPENPLDILAQHVVAMVSAEDWSSTELYDCVRGAYPFRGLTEAAFRATLEMLAGKYPSSASSALRAKVSWDRVNDRLTALPGTRLLAVRSGGTIPDRGMYGLVLADRKTKVGELDEEFVFETRVGDNFLLGSQVWKALEITEDRVIAEPAPGEVPRMPFWRGDFPWRPYDLGQRIGAFRRELMELIRQTEPQQLERLLAMDDGEMDEALGETSGLAEPLLSFLRRDCALDRNALVLVVTHLTRQLDAVGHVATDRAVVIETYEDEVGVPRMVVHSPFGGRVNGPWGIALAGAIRSQMGVEAQVTPGDDGILIRFQDAEIEPPTQLVARLTSGDARELLLRELPASPVFGAQFRMNAARALLLPREQGGKRTPLWLSRLKAKDLLQAVQRFDDFPIVLETYRDCLRDVMDVAGLTATLEAIERGEIEVVTHESVRPSPLAAGLDYRFAMRYVYEYDQPRGETQLAALSLNRELLADLLQDGALAALLKPEAVVQVVEQAARTADEARARNPDELAQLLYDFGDLTEAEVAHRVESSGDEAIAWLLRLEQSGRVVRRRIGGDERWVSAERASDYLDIQHYPQPVLRRYLAHAGPTPTDTLAARYGLSEELVQRSLGELGEVVAFGRFAPEGPEQWVDRRMLETIHRRTLNLLRKEVRPVSLSAYADYLAEWHGIGARKRDLTATLRELRGLAVSGVAWERDVLPGRIADFDPSELAERCQTGEVVWTAEGGKDARRARVRFFFRGEGQLFHEREPDEDALSQLGDTARTTRDFLIAEGAALLADVADGTGLSRAAAEGALVELVLAGLGTNDTLAALHAVLGFEPSRAARPGRRSSLEAQLAERMGRRSERPRALTPLRWREAKRRAREVVSDRLATERLLAWSETGAGAGSAWTGRWSLVHRTSVLGKASSPDEVTRRRARLLLERWGVVSKACLEREAACFSWDALYPVLARLEVRGEVRRGYFVEGLPGAQFALPQAVEQLRAVAGSDAPAAPRVLSAVDPAQLFGSEDWGSSLRFTRVPQAAVASVRGEPVAAMSLDSDETAGAVIALDQHPALSDCLRALATWWVDRTNAHLKVDRWQGADVLGTEGMSILAEAGFVREGSAMLWTNG
ncbi:MAG: DEAD/DEAH box helicase [Chloroflexota bacterium]